MAKKGRGLLMVWADVPAEKEEEFNRWYKEEHLAERLSVRPTAPRGPPSGTSHR